MKLQSAVYTVVPLQQYLQFAIVPICRGSSVSLIFNESRTSSLTPGQKSFWAQTGSIKIWLTYKVRSSLKPIQMFYTVMFMLQRGYSVLTRVFSSKTWTSMRQQQDRIGYCCPCNRVALSHMLPDLLH